MVEVPASELHAFLLEKQKDGYTVVGVEQVEPISHVLGQVALPDSIVVVLGRRTSLDCRLVLLNRVPFP